MNDRALAAFGVHCPLLHTVNVECSFDITGAGVAALARGCPRLREVSLSDSEDVDDRGLIALSEHCPGVVVLRLGCCRISNGGIEAVARGCPALESLFLDGCQVSDAGIVALGAHCKRLTVLDLQSTKVTDVGIAALTASCPQLQRLTLVKCEAPTDVSVMCAALRGSRIEFLGLTGCPRVSADWRRLYGGRSVHVLFEHLRRDGSSRLAESARALLQTIGYGPSTDAR